MKKFLDIEVQIEGQSVWRRYPVDNYDNLDEDSLGATVADMVDSLRNAQMNEDFFREAKAGAI